MKSVLLLFPLLIAAVRATGETPLRQAANGSRVRFLGLRTFDNPVVVGMEKNGNKTTLRRKTAGGAGGYEPGKIAADESKALGRQAWLEYIRTDNISSSTDGADAVSGNCACRSSG